MSFRKQVYKIVKQIPRGKVTTYGSVAGMIGSPRAARQVGFALRALTLEEREVPWWRVINAKGYISISHGEGGIERVIQRDLLIGEGVVVDDEFCVDLERFLWQV